MHLPQKQVTSSKKKSITIKLPNALNFLLKITPETKNHGLWNSIEPQNRASARMIMGLWKVKAWTKPKHKHNTPFHRKAYWSLRKYREIEGGRLRWRTWIWRWMGDSNRGSAKRSLMLWHLHLYPSKIKMKKLWNANVRLQQHPQFRRTKSDDVFNS